MSLSAEIIKTCFQDIISIKGGCGDIVSTSGLYSNDIDIDTDFLNEIITRQYVDAKDLFQKKRDFAIQNVVDQVITYLSSQMNATTLLNNYRVGHFQDDLKMIAGDGNLKGVNIDMCNADSFLNLFVSEISLQLNKTGPVDVLVYDLLQDKLLDTITIDCIANEVVTVFPSKTYQSSRKKLNLIFVYDSTGLSSNTTYLKKTGCLDCNGAIKGVNNPYEKVQAIKIASASQKIRSNLKVIGETGGMSIVHSVSCNHYSWLCSYSNILAMPILYKFGSVIMQFARDVSPNDRINTSVTINAEEIDRRKNYYDMKFSEVFANVMENIKLPSDSRCFSCKEGVKHVISTQ